MMYDGGMMSGWGMFGGLGLTHWLVFGLIVVAILYPVGLILQKLGYSPFWSVLAFVPGVNVIGLWVVALSGESDTHS